LFNNNFFFATVKVDSSDYTYEDIERGINEALDLLGGSDKFLNAGERVLLKPNMVEGVDNGKHVTTHP
jgi:uncharacterized protein (DUF362 family)